MSEKWWESAPVAKKSEDWWQSAPLAADDYDFTAVEREAAAQSPGLPVSDAAPVVATPDFRNVIGASIGTTAEGPPVPMRGGVPDYSGVFRDPEADNDGFGAIALRALVGRAPEIVANLIELPANANEAITRTLGMEPSDTGIMGRMRGVLRSGADAVRDLGYQDDMDQAGYGEPSVTGAQIVEAVDPTADIGAGERFRRAATFIPETLIGSAPDMAATLNPLTLAGYIGSRTNEIAENRAENDQREDVTTGDLAIGGVAAPIEALLERFTTMRLLPHGTTLATPGVLPAMARIAQELGLQGSLGGVEELVPYLAEQAGTEQGATAQGALENFVGGTLAEGGLGGVVQGAKEGANAIRGDFTGNVAPTPEHIAQALEPQEAAVEPSPAAGIESVLANLPPEQVQEAVDTVGQLFQQNADADARWRRPEPAPPPANPSPEVPPTSAAAQPSPVQPDTPPTREAAEPAAQIQTTPEGVQAPAAQSAPVSAGADLVDRPKLYHVTSASGPEFSTFRSDRPTYFGDSPSTAARGAMGQGRTLQAEITAEKFANTPETPVHFMDVDRTFAANPDAEALYASDESGTSVVVRDASKHARIVGRVIESQRPGEPSTYTVEPTPVERRADAIEDSRLQELRTLRKQNALAPEQQTELLDLAERDRVAAKVAGRRIPGVLNMEARNEAEASGSLKPVQAFADADNFKAVNDRLGHEIGDSVIRQMGELFASQLGEGNVFHRGGDEFVMQADTPEQLDAAMNAVREQLAGATLRVTLDNGEVVEQQGVGFSYGAGPTIQEAESAQYRDKEARKRAGLRTGRDEAPRAVPDTGAVRGEPGAAGQEAGQGRADPAEEAGEVTPRERTTSTKNAARLTDPILRDAAKVTNDETMASAQQTLRDNPERAREIVERLRTGGVSGISVADEAVLLVEKVNLQKARDAAADRASNSNITPEQRAVAQREWSELEGRIAEMDEATTLAGREWGRLGQLRARHIRDDFSFAALERKARVTKGAPLTASESAEIKQMAEKIEALQARVDATEQRLADTESIAAFEELFKLMAKQSTPKRRPTLERLREAAEESRRALAGIESVPRRKGQSGASINPAAFFHLTRIGAYHVANGAVKFADWVSRMRADVGAALDDFRDVLPEIFRAAKTQADEPVQSSRTAQDVLASIEGAPTPTNVRALIGAYVGAGLRGEEAVMGAAARDLDLEIGEVRRLFVQTSPRKMTLTEAQQELRDLRALARLQNEIERLEAGQPKPAPGKKAPESDEIRSKREQVAKLLQLQRQRRSEQLSAQRDAERGEVDPEERYQELRGKQLTKQITELQQRIAAGDFARKPSRVPRALSEANERARYELAKAKEEFIRRQFEAEMAARPPLRKIFGGVADAMNLARAFMTSLDLSGVLRQGGFITYGHPVRAARSLIPMLKAFASEQKAHAVQDEIENRPNASLYRKYGLELTGIGQGPLTKVEEAYASRWLDRVPTALGGGLVRGSGRAYSTFLNKLRADSFDAMAAGLAKTETLTPEEGKTIAGFINVATGRGKIGMSENAGEVLNTVFFAPRLVASRFQLLAGQPLYGGTPRTRKLIAQEYARFLIGASVAIGLAGLMKDDEDETPLLVLDPRSADFGKVRFGKTFLDPLAGLAQVTTVFSRLASGETTTAKGVKPLRAQYTLTDLRRALGEDIDPHKLGKDGELPFGSSSGADVLGRFLRTKLAPVPGAIVNLLSGKDVTGQSVTPLETAAQMVTPMSFNNLLDIMEEQGVERGTAITMLGLLGMGVQHRGGDEAKEARDALGTVDDAQADIKTRLAALPTEKWASEFDKLKDEYAPLLDGVELDVYQRAGKYGEVGEPRRTAKGEPVLVFEGEDGKGSVMGELTGYPRYGRGGRSFATDGVKDRVEALDRIATTLAGGQEITRDSVLKLTEDRQLQLPAALRLFDDAQEKGNGGEPIDKKTRETILEQVRFLSRAEQEAGAEMVKAAKDGKPPAYNASRELVQKALDKQYPED